MDSKNLKIDVAKMLLGKIKNMKSSSPEITITSEKKSIDGDMMKDPKMEGGPKEEGESSIEDMLASAREGMGAKSPMSDERSAKEEEFKKLLEEFSE